MGVVFGGMGVFISALGVFFSGMGASGSSTGVFFPGMDVFLTGIDGVGIAGDVVGKGDGVFYRGELRCVPIIESRWLCGIRHSASVGFQPGGCIDNRAGAAPQSGRSLNLASIQMRGNQVRSEPERGAGRVTGQATFKAQPVS